MHSFSEMVRRRIIKHPTEKGFNEKKWDEAWANSGAKTSDDEGIYTAGHLFNKILFELRSKIFELYKQTKEIPLSDLIISFCGMANRDVLISQKIANETFKNSNYINPFGIRTSNNIVGNELSLDEVVHGCVDGIEIALRNAIKNSFNVTDKKTNNLSIDFVRQEILISQMYSTNECYWKSLLWGASKLKTIDKSENIYNIIQDRTDFTIKYESSLIRNQKIQLHRNIAACNDNILKEIKHYPCIIPVRIGRKKTLKKILLNDLPKKQKDHCAHLIINISSIYEMLPEEFIDENVNGYNFSISDALEVFRLLSVLSSYVFDKFPQNDTIDSISKLKHFCPLFNKMDLIRSIVNASGIEFEKCNEILNFLTFNGDMDKDLWCYPVINVDDRFVTVLVAAAHSPVFQRVVEHWLIKMNVDLSRKGAKFEEEVLEKINRNLKKNKLLSSYDYAASGRLKISEEENEEIDFFFRLGRVIVIGEVKSIVATDSPISLYRTKETLTYACEQAKRKTSFFKRNIKTIFDKIKWEFDESVNYECIPVVLASSSIAVGAHINDVPICDLRILTKYLISPTIPLLSSDKEDIAWFEIYKNFEDAQNNFAKYLSNPPQLTVDSDDFEYVTCKIPMSGASKIKIAYTRLVKKNSQDIKIFQKKYAFPIMKHRDFDAIVNTIDYLV